MSDAEEAPSTPRKKIGVIDTEPKKADQAVKGLSKQQAALRQAAIDHFKANKVKAFVAKQVEYVNSARQIGEGIQFLFDREGRPPANAPIEEVIAERKRLENQIRWLEAITTELRNNLVKVREIEDLALDLLDVEPE